jgi:hypothetical protein
MHIGVAIIRTKLKELRESNFFKQFENPPQDSGKLEGRSEGRSEEKYRNKRRSRSRSRERYVKRLFLVINVDLLDRGGITDHVIEVGQEKEEDQGLGIETTKNVRIKCTQ